MRKLFLSPTCGRSADLPANISHLFASEDATYRMTVTKSQLEMADENVPSGFTDSYQDGNEKVTKTVKTLFGEEEFVHWDATLPRYYVEFDDLEEALEDIGNATGLRITLGPWNREDPFQTEFIDAIFGFFPEIGEEDIFAELETDLPNFELMEKDQEGEEWKQMG